MRNNVRVTSTENLFFQKEEETESKGINPVSSSQTQDIPRNEQGSAENPEAYRLYLAIFFPYNY